jgi:hypothetical protein
MVTKNPTWGVLPFWAHLSSASILRFASGRLEAGR